MIYGVEPVEIRHIEIDYRILSRSKKSAGENLGELIASIKKNGLIQPIGIIPLAYKKYKLIFGLRRLLVCKKLGYKEINASIII